MKDKLDAKKMTNKDWADLKADSIPQKTVKHHSILLQDLQEIRGDRGSYQRWVDNHPKNTQKGKGGDRFDFVTEDVRANPDSLREDEGMYADSQLTRPQEIMGDAIEHLQGRQKQVYLLTFRQGLSFAATAKRLHMSRSTVQTYRNRAARFITAYCEAAIQRGECDVE